MSYTNRRWINEWDVRAVERRTPWQKITPPQLFASSFIFLIAAGTIGFRFLPGLYVGEPLGWLDSLFVATSAISITGLSVVDAATFFTPLGQAYLLLLIQVGGLGVITFTTLIIIGLGRRLSLRHEALVASTEVSPFIDVRQLTRDVFRFTFAIEGIGAALLFLLWVARFGPIEAAWHAVFHAVTAFCNAGFSTFTNSVLGFQRDPATLFVLAALIVLGSIGFLTLEELYLQRKAIREGRRAFRMSIHSRIVLTVTALVLAGGAFLYTFFEWRVAMSGLPIWARPFVALFMSASGRTAGFSVVDPTLATESSAFLSIILMAIGGAPGSMAGGMKVTTVALIGLLAWSRFRGSSVTSLWGRTIPEETIQRAIGLFVVVFGIMTAAIFGFTMTEAGSLPHQASDGRFIRLMFEAVSAFNTTGASMGTTPGLSPAGQWIAILLMYLGRVGPLTFAAAIALRSPTPAGEFRYAYEDVVIG